MLIPHKTILFIALTSSVILGTPKPFNGIGYSGYRDGQGPGFAEPSRSQVEEDLQILSEFTHGIRSYGSGLQSHGSWLPELCDDAGLNLYMGVWISQVESNNYTEMDAAITLVNRGHVSIKSIIVGNEYLLRSEVDDNIPLAVSEEKLINYINYVKDRVPEHIIVTTAEPMWWWSKHSDALWQAVDEIYWHVHPWWEDNPIDQAINNVQWQFENAKQRLANLDMSDKRLVLTETGWPTGVVRGPSVGSPENQATYLGNLHSFAWENELEYWFFSGFDAKWKESAEGPVGSQWGMWYSDRSPKHVINILDQLIPSSMYYEQTGITTIGYNEFDFQSSRTAAQIFSSDRTLKAADLLGRNRTPRGNRFESPLFILSED